jgi:branched-chain amino acid transport system permease protein
MQGSLFPDSIMGLRLSIEVLIAPVIGGLGSLFGPIVGAFFVVPLMEASNVLGQSTGLFGVNTLIYGVVILLVITFLPEGIWPRFLGYLRSKGRW